MVTVAVVFHSVTGATRQLAQAVAAGAAVIQGVNVMTAEIFGADIVEGTFTGLVIDNSQSVVIEVRRPEPPVLVVNNPAPLAVGILFAPVPDIAQIGLGKIDLGDQRVDVVGGIHH